MKQSSSELSSLAAKYLNMTEREFFLLLGLDISQFVLTDNQFKVFKDMKALAGSVLSQDEIVGQDEN